jgi:hypothetical protein
MTLIVMIVHGHGDKTFVQYFYELWPNDPNFMIGSLLCLFHSVATPLWAKCEGEATLPKVGTWSPLRLPKIQSSN